MTRQIWQCHPPALVDLNRTNRPVGAAALWAFLAGAPGSMDCADEVETRIVFGRQRDRHLALAGVGFSFRRFIDHAATMTGKIRSRPVGRGGRFCPPRLVTTRQ